MQSSHGPSNSTENNALSNRIVDIGNCGIGSYVTDNFVNATANELSRHRSTPTDFVDHDPVAKFIIASFPFPTLLLAHEIVSNESYGSGDGTCSLRTRSQMSGVETGDGTCIA